ncbi:MAG TPA: CBS domain-containing protein [Thermoplasmata archaeon]|nr:CBS domain-containing protein [Thermoplasmata archaeon]
MPTSAPTAGELMTADPITIGADAPVSQALGLMRARAIHELPVLQRRRLLGMITFESIARRTNLPLATKVSHLMLLPPVVTPSTPYAELAEALLAAGLRAAPVLGKKGEVVGIVSRTDLVRALPALPELARHRVEEVQSPVSLLLKETEPCGRLFAQIRLIEDHPLPVADRRGRLVGAVGIADFGRILWRPVAAGKRDAGTSRSVFDVEVGTIMHSPALTVAAGTTAGEAAARMTAAKVSSVFVVEDGRPTGVVSQADLLGLAVGGDRGGAKVGDVYVQIHGLRGSSDPEILTEIDRVVAKGLRHVGRRARPILLSLHVTPHATHRSGDATVQARLHTDRGIFYASETGWNFFAGVAEVMEELAEQVRRSAGPERAHRRATARTQSVDEPQIEDPELEAKIRAATGDREE